MISTKGLKYSYNQSEVIEFPDISIGKNEQFLILGKSGCGKTTLLNLLSGLLKPQEGEVVINDTVVSSLPGAKLDHFRGQNIGFVFQTPHFFNALTVQENLMFTQKMAGKPVDKEAIKSILEELSIGTKLKSKINELSVGEKQRVSIARALVNKPLVVFADEPTSALDDENSESVSGLLKMQTEKHNATLVIVTHDNRLKDRFSNHLLL